MRALILALAAAGFVALSLPGYAADEPYTAQPKAGKPGRAIDEGGTVKSGPLDKPGRAIEEGAVKAGGPSTKPGRTADEEKAKKKKKHKKAEPQG